MVLLHLCSLEWKQFYDVSLLLVGMNIIILVHLFKTETEFIRFYNLVMLIHNSGYRKRTQKKESERINHCRYRYQQYSLYHHYPPNGFSSPILHA